MVHTSFEPQALQNPRVSDYHDHRRLTNRAQYSNTHMVTNSQAVGPPPHDLTHDSNGFEQLAPPFFNLELCIIMCSRARFHLMGELVG